MWYYVSIAVIHTHKTVAQFLRRCILKSEMTAMCIAARGMKMPRKSALGRQSAAAAKETRSERQPRFPERIQASSAKIQLVRNLLR